MALSSFGNLFNTVADPVSTEAQISSANKAFCDEHSAPNGLEQAVGALSRNIEPVKLLLQEHAVREIKQCLSQGAVTAKIKGDGYNLKIGRLGEETNRNWARRTESIARTMNEASNGAIVVPHVTFGSGRIIAQVEQGTPADGLFKAVA